MGALDGLPFDTGGKRAAQQCYGQHDGKGGDIAGVAHQSKIGVGKKVIEDEDGAQGCQQAVAVPRGGHGDGEDAQDIDHDHIFSGKVRSLEEKAHGGAGSQDQEGLEKIPDGEALLEKIGLPGVAGGPLDLVRDDVDIQVRSQLSQTVHQTLGAQEGAAFLGTAAQHDLGDPADFSVFRDLNGGGIPVDRADPGAQLLCKMQIVP